MPTYPWKRYWSTDDTSPTLVDGFLAIIPENKNAAKQLEEFDDVPCLIMLSDPGMGKTKEIEADFQTCLEPRLYCNLGHVTGQTYFLRETFDSEAFRLWKSGNETLTLFLDSLDEGNQNITGLGELLLNELEKLNPSRIRLRITCRSAEWAGQNTFRRGLEKLWPDEDFLEIRLSPLSTADVVIAAQFDGIDADKFLIDVFEKRVTHLAANPVTLGLLLREFQRTGELSGTQFDLFERGAKALGEEPIDGRPASRQDALTPTERLIVAGRIAAVMALSGRSSIWTGPEDEAEPIDITISALSGYSERRVDGREFYVTEREINETIHKGLFTGIGPNRIRFIHQTFAEFLAAWHLANEYFSDETIIELIGRDFSYPQLDQIAAWISNRRPGVFQHLVKNAPLVLLRGEVVSTSDDLRYQLTERLLKLFDDSEASDQWARSHYDRLNNHKIAEQLRPYLVDKKKGWLVRRVAIDIAEANNVIEVQEELATIANDDSELHPTRVNAAYAVLRIGDKNTKRKLLPLLNASDDKDRELMGVALSANWRDSLTAKDVFEMLHQPLHNFFGSYNMFFHELGETLSSEDLPYAMKWLLEQPASGADAIGLERISDRIVSMAWKAARTDEQVLGQLAKIAVSKASGLAELLSTPGPFSTEDYRKDFEAISSDDDMRRRIWLRSAAQTRKEDLYLLSRSRFAGLQPNDLPWLVETWSQSESADVQEKLIDSAATFIGPWETPPVVVDTIAKACKNFPEFEDRFGYLFRSVELGSNDAESQRETFEKYFNWRKKRQVPEKAALSPSPTERALELLDEFETGDVDSWWQLTLWMTARPDGSSKIFEHDSDLTSFPVWQDSSEEFRSRVIHAAFQYLVEADSKEDEWIEKRIVFRPAIAGYRALRLLNRLAPEKLKELTPDVWTKWAGTIYFQPEDDSFDSKDSRADQQTLIRAVHAADPSVFASVLSRDINRSLREDGSFQLQIHKLEPVWDEGLSAVIRKILSEKNLPIGILRQLLEELFAHGDPFAVSFACQLVPTLTSKIERDSDSVLLAIELLIRYEKAGCWDKVFALISNESEYGRQIIENGIFRFDNRVPASFSEKQLADLFIWLTRQYPHAEDPIHRGTYSPGARDEITQWRESILLALIRRGTNEAATEVERVRIAFPNLDYIKFRHFEALQNLHSNAWTPMAPPAVLSRFANEPIRRLERRYEAYSSLDPRARRSATFRFREHTFITSLLAIGSILLVFAVGWDKMEIWTWTIAAAGFFGPRIYESVRLRKVSWFPSFHDVLDDEKLSLYSMHGLDPNERTMLEIEISKLRLIQHST